jgi:hypothetical protein
MDANLKTKWVEALRSGKYEQGKRALCHEGKFCCLGVLADVSGLGKWITRAPDERLFEFVPDDLGATTLPDGFLQQAELSPADQGELWRLNDGVSGRREHSFTEIADYIEANL